MTHSIIAKTVSVAARATMHPRRIFGPLDGDVAKEGAGMTLLGSIMMTLESVAVAAALLTGNVCSVEVVLDPRMAMVCMAACISAAC